MEPYDRKICRKLWTAVSGESDLDSLVFPADLGVFCLPCS